MKEKYNKIILIFFVITSLFLGVSFFAWALFPDLQMITFYKNLPDAFAGKEDKILNANFAFYPMTYVEPELRYDFMNRIFVRYLEGRAPSPKFTIFAKEKLEESIPYNKNYANNFLALGKAYDVMADLSTGDKKSMYTQAENNYKKALELMPKMQRILYAYSVNLANQGRLDEALLMAESALKENPKVAESHYYVGIMLFQKSGAENFNKSLKEMELAFDGNYSAGNNLAKIIYEKLLVYYYNQKDISNLKIVLSRLIVLNDSQAEVYKKIINYMDKTGVVPVLNMH